MPKPIAASKRRSSSCPEAKQLAETPPAFRNKKAKLRQQLVGLPRASLQFWDVDTPSPARRNPRIMLIAGSSTNPVANSRRAAFKPHF